MKGGTNWESTIETGTRKPKSGRNTTPRNRQVLKRIDCWTDNRIPNRIPCIWLHIVLLEKRDGSFPVLFYKTFIGVTHFLEDVGHIGLISKNRSFIPSVLFEIISKIERSRFRT